ncbi:hypothetical protein D3C74_332640 [compost metagenome]
MIHGLQRIWIAFKFDIIPENIIVDGTLLGIGDRINIRNTAENYLDILPVHLALRINHQLGRSELAGRELGADQVKALTRLHILRKG